MTALSLQELGEGFVRPLRSRVIHTFCDRPSAVTPGQAEDMAKDPKSWSSCWCAVCGRRLPIEQFTWGDGEPVGS